MNTAVQKCGKIILAVALACVVAVGALYLSGAIGLSKSDLEADLRASQKIPQDWQITGSISDSIAAFLCYPADRSDHVFSIYVNRPGLSFGYFFRGGGDLTGDEAFIGEYTIEGYGERAFISMNHQHVARLEIDDGQSTQTIQIDSAQPFAIVLPVNCGTVNFYDQDGNPVDFYPFVF